jgi:23S rRNA (cytidine1920-2'-O)/16S rRNA (cytidine1409-2'-O)-methyltransferase
VGRGALKLLSVLDPFQVDPAGAVAADLGASTGGFTEVLLQRGAKRVYAIDVGKGLLHYRLRDDPRVVLMEGVNARHLRGLDEPMDLVVGDLSFISIRLILPTVARLLRPQGEAVILVKPQFEVGRKGVARGGRVRNEGLRQEAIASSKRAAEENGMVVLGSADSGLAGGRAGNVEHFLHLRQS